MGCQRVSRQLAGDLRVPAELDPLARTGLGVPGDEPPKDGRICRVKARELGVDVPLEPHPVLVPLGEHLDTAPLPNRKCVGDITYLPLADGSNIYLATVIDCCSRKLAGWAVADHMRTELFTDALKAALAERGSLRGAIFHADHGAQYTSKDLAKLCSQLGAIQSLGGVGSSADNALAEAFSATLKRETLAGAAAFSDEKCRRQIFRWAVRYNTRRRHSCLGHQARNTYENTLTATLPEAA